MEKSLAQKMGLKPNTKSYLDGAPDGFEELIASVELDVKSRLSGEFGYIHFFVTTQKDFIRFKKLKEFLAPNGSLWVSWPKSKQIKSDLNIKKVIELGYNFGLVESKAISVNEVWSALKFTHPKPGKTYHNSYGKLPDSRQD